VHALQQLLNSQDEEVRLLAVVVSLDLWHSRLDELTARLARLEVAASVLLAAGCVN
jgi:hypothetical protein